MPAGHSFVIADDHPLFRGALKEALADLTLENRMLKKSMIADGGDDE